MNPDTASADTVVAFVTCPPDKAEALARILVESKTAACVNVIAAVQSVYWWKGAIQKDGEALLLIKTAADRVPELKAVVLKHHPYELPEFITVNVAEGHAPYLQWINDSTR